MTLSANDVTSLEARAKQGCTQCRKILDEYRKQQESAAVTADASDVIGTVMEVEGDVTVATPGQAAVTAAVDTPVHLNDVVTTGKDARVLILFIDETEMTLSADTKLSVDEWVFDPDDTADNKGVYSILQGTFLYVSGLIAKKENPDVTVNTPVGSIGIRGTEFWGGETDGEYGVLVNEGQVNVKTDAGEVSVGKGLGTFVRGRKFRPAAAQAWKEERKTRAVATVHLKRAQQARQRVAQQRQKHQEMRTRYKAFQQKRRGQMQERRQEQRQNLQQNRQPQNGQQNPQQNRQGGATPQQPQLDRQKEIQNLERLQKLQQNQLRNNMQQSPGRQLQQQRRMRPY